MSDELKPTNRAVDRKRSTNQMWAVQGFLVRVPVRQFTPPTDVIEMDDRILVLVEIAGMKGDDFRIALDSKRLVIAGQRPRPHMPDAAYHQVEIGFGEFRVELPLPWTVKEDEVTAAYQNGFLKVELPREEARRIPIVDVNNEGE